MAVGAAVPSLLLITIQAHRYRNKDPGTEIQTHLEVAQLLLRYVGQQLLHQPPQLVDLKGAAAIDVIILKQVGESDLKGSVGINTVSSTPGAWDVPPEMNRLLSDY